MMMMMTMMMMKMMITMMIVMMIVNYGSNVVMIVQVMVMFPMSGILTMISYDDDDDHDIIFYLANVNASKINPARSIASSALNNRIKTVHL